MVSIYMFNVQSSCQKHVIYCIIKTTTDIHAQKTKKQTQLKLKIYVCIWCNWLNISSAPIKCKYKYKYSRSNWSNANTNAQK